MKMGNAAFELAELRAENERQAGIARAQNELKQEGLDHCVDCDQKIDLKRRQVLPSARRCCLCQQAIEGKFK